MNPQDIDGARLLVVDDDPMMLGMATVTLRHAGFTVTEVSDGKQALALFERKPFDLLLLDVMMPDLDGYEVCARIRRMPQGARVPILMLTGLFDTGSIDLAYQAGATDFISKPINWTLLSHRVRYALRSAFAVESAIHSRERLERAQQIANMGSWQIETDGKGFECSPEMARLFGAPAEAISCVSPLAFLERVCEADRPAVQAMRDAALRDGQAYQLTFRIKRFDGEQRIVHEQASAVRDSAGRQIGIEGITQDVTERVEAERRISRLARFDTLTGLPNRSFFDKLAGSSLERARRRDGKCAWVHLDIDRFKSVNDAMGHAGGDAILVALSERLRAASRIDGSATTDSVLARVGPNSFAVLLVDVTADRQAGIVAERLMSSVSTAIAGPAGDVVLTASIGIALFPRDAGDTASLARCAEQSVYAAKAAGRAQYRFFDEAMNKGASARLSLEAELRRAVADGQLCVYYQPKVDAASGAILGAEALVRWQHPQRGLIAPSKFIALAEDSGQILALTDCVLENVCTDLRRWIDQGLKAVPVSVNLSSPSFASDELPGQLLALLRRHQLTPDMLLLEVTESLLMTDVDKVVGRLQALRSSGFGVSLDDFGTGYSSLSYLKRFPIDELKIDRSFVTDAWRGGRDAAIAGSIIALGREFGLRVVAEGVETTDQARHLLTQGCFCQQGYLFARPQPSTEFARLLSEGLADTRISM